MSILAISSNRRQKKLSIPEYSGKYQNWTIVQWNLIVSTKHFSFLKLIVNIA